MELTGISLNQQPTWEVSGNYDITQVLLSLGTLIPDNSILYIEGTCVADEVGDFLSAHPAPEVTKVYPGTIAPRPAIFHVPATERVLCELARLSERHAEMEICDHLHVYHDGRVILSGYDFGFSSLYISQEISEERVKDFSLKIRCSYAAR